MPYENVRLFEPGDPSGGRSFPLVNLGDTVYRMRITVRWQPSSELANVACDVVDDATGELIAWELVPRTEGEQELTDKVHEAVETLAGLRRYLEEPFPSSTPEGAAQRSRRR